MYDPNAAIYPALEARFPTETWHSQDTDGSFRPLFRDYPNAWTRTHLLSLEHQKFHLMPLGKAVLEGRVDPSEAFLRAFEQFQGNGVRPFATLAAGFLEANRALTFDEIYWGIVRNFRPGTDDFAQAIAAGPDGEVVTDTRRRRIKFLLEMLENVNGIRQVGNEEKWIPWDISVLKRLSRFAPTAIADVSISALCDAASQNFSAAGLVFEPELVRRLVGSLLAKRFVILTGLSGSGKTSIARFFARWICGSEEQYAIVRVGANWTSGEVLLGYPDALDSSKYRRTRTLDLLLRARAHPNDPHFVILDEMNLSHVERYFADFLSAIETETEPLHLHSDAGDREGVPRQIEGLPRNLFIMGTVNVDETTYMFSPKVLDRANVMEFRTDETALTTFLEDAQQADDQAINGQGSVYGPAFVAEAQTTPDLAGLGDRHGLMSAELLLLFKLLQGHNLEFGLRTAWEITRFCYFHTMRLTQPATADAAAQGLRDALDVQILQKILPRLHGSRKNLEPVLRTLRAYCTTQHNWNGNTLANAQDIRAAAEVAARGAPTTTQAGVVAVPPTDFFPRTVKKIDRMLLRVQRDGFVSFAEA